MITFTLVKQDFAKLETYAKSLVAIALGGALAVVGDTLTNPTAITHLTRADLPGLAKTAAGGAVSGLVLYWMRSKSPSALPAPAAVAQVVEVAARAKTDVTAVQAAADAAKSAVEDVVASSEKK